MVLLQFLDGGIQNAGPSGRQHPDAKDHQTLTGEYCKTEQDPDEIPFTPSFSATLKTALKSFKGDNHC